MALRRFVRPFLAIQLAAVALVVAYHLFAGVRAACAALAALRLRAGLPFSALAGALAGGLLPEALKRVLDPRRNRLRGRGREIAFNVAFFAFNAVVVDLFYRLMARLFGAQPSVVTVLEKVAFDQAIFTPLWLPLIIALFTWRQSGFRFGVTAAALRGDFYQRRVVPLLVSNWAFWIPMTIVIYALPVTLQFLLFALALAAWSLIMVFVAEG